MKKLMFIALVFCCFMVSGETCIWAQANYDMSKYFPLGVDNTWVYKMINVIEGDKGEEIFVSSVQDRYSSSEGDIYVVEINVGENPIFHYRQGAGGVYLHKTVEDDGYSIFSPPPLIFGNRMQLNKEETSSAKAKLFNNRDELIDEYDIEIKSKFEGTEDIVVPAGKFSDCLKINFFLSFYKRRGTMTIERTIWLAKNIGKVKEINTIKVFGGTARSFYNQLDLLKAILCKNN
jgi:hypothetical protein